MGNRRVFAMPGLVLALVLGAGIARAESLIRLDVWLDEYSQVVSPSVYRDLQFSLVFDPNVAPLFDNGVNTRGWAIEQLELCGQTVSDPGYFTITGGPTQGYSQISLPNLPATPGRSICERVPEGDRVLFIHGLRVNMVYDDPWPADNSAANWPSPQEIFGNLNVDHPPNLWCEPPVLNGIVPVALTVTYFPKPIIHADGFEN